MAYSTDGSIPRDTTGFPVGSVYAPNTGTVGAQGGTVATDATGAPYAPMVVAGASGTPFVAKAANVAPTLADASMVAALSPANTGLPVNVPVILQKANNASTGSVATLAQAFTNKNVAGNTIVVVAGCGNGTAMTVADSAGNTYTQAVTKANSTTFEAAIFYAVGILAGANTVTVTNAGTAASVAMEIYEVSGLLAQVVAQPDQSSSATGTSATPTISAIAASSPNSLAFMGIAVGTAAQATSVTSGTNWTLDSTQNTTTPAGLYSFGALSQFLGNTTPVIPTATIAGSEPYAAVAAIFKPVVIGVQGTMTLAGYNYTHLTATGTTQVKIGSGILHSIIINAHGASATIEFDDALSHTTPVIGIITLPSTISGAIPISLEYDIQLSTGLSVTIGTATVDITIVWK